MLRKRSLVPCDDGCAGLFPVTRAGHQISVQHYRHGWTSRYLHGHTFHTLSTPLALCITSNMLGMVVDDVGRMSTTHSGKLPTAGRIREASPLQGGLDISLSIPTVISGEKYTINAMTDSDCVIIPFTHESDRSWLVSNSARKTRDKAHLTWQRVLNTKK